MEQSLRGRIITGILSCAILAGGVVGFQILMAKPAQELGAAPQPPLPEVETIALEAHSGNLDIRVDGMVVPYREIHISAEVAGRIAEKFPVCRAGSYVRQGADLIQIDRRDYDFEVRRLRAQLAEANANIEELEVEIANTSALIKLADESVTLAQNEVRRLVNLASVVSQSNLDVAKRDEVNARNSQLTLRNQEQLLKTRRNRLQSSRQLVETQLEKAILDLGRTLIKAPADGVIVADLVEQDDFVSKGAELVTFEDTSAVEVKCNLRMDELYWLRVARSQNAARGEPASEYQIPRTPVTVVYQLPQTNIRYAWDGELTRFDGMGLDERTRTVPCRVEVPRPRQGRLLGGATQNSALSEPPPLVRGMYVTVEMHATPQTALVRVPERAVHPGKTGWVVRDGALRRIRPLRLIELVERDDGPERDSSDLEARFWIADADASQLAVGDRLVVSPLVAVYDGMPVQEQAKR